MATTKSTQLPELMEQYQKLTDEQLMIMNILAVYYSYCSLTVMISCLSSLGIKASTGKALKSSDIKPYYDALNKLNLIEHNPKLGNYRCNRHIAELITRELVTQRQFQRYFEVLTPHITLANTTYLYFNSDEECIRNARIQFYCRDYTTVKKFISVRQRYSTKFNSIDSYLSWLLNPFDPEWLAREHPVMTDELAGYIGVHQLSYLKNDATINAFLAQQSAKTPDSYAHQFARLIYAELLLLRGDWDALVTLITEFNTPEMQAIAAALTFLQGNTQAAINQFENALSALRKLTNKRTAYFANLSGIFYPIALLKTGDHSLHTKAATLLAQAIKLNSPWAEVYQYLSLFLQILQGNLDARAQLLAYDSPYTINNIQNDIADPPVLQAVLLMVIKYWVKPDYFKSVTTANHKLYQYIHNNGYHWPAAELARLYTHIQPDNAKAYDHSFFSQHSAIALTNLFVCKPDWELALDALQGINPSNAKISNAPITEKPIRLIWLVSFHEATQSLLLEPREQKQQGKSGWTKGRVIALKRLRAEASSFDYLSEQDLALCNTLREYRDSWSGMLQVEFSSKMPLSLVGHPLLFWANSPEVRLEVIKEEPILNVSKPNANKQINISLDPKPSEDKTIHISKDSPTRLKVVKFTEEHQKIYKILGPKGLEVPESAQERVLQTLASISNLLTVHSNISGSTSHAEQVNADLTPRVHLLPLGSGLKAGIYIRPFQTGGAYYRPGHGSENVLAEVDGKRVQTQRDLKQERANAAEVIATCPILRQAEQEETGDWLIYEPEDCLEFLLQIQALPADKAILEWPEGVKFSVLGQLSASNLSVSIKRQNDWFGIDGELKINETQVIELQQLLSLLDNSQGRFLQLQDGQFIALTEAFRRRLHDLKAYADSSAKKLRLNPLAAITLEDWENEVGELKSDKDWKNHIKRLKSARELQPVVPSTFQAELREYQQDGFAWLSRLAHWGVGACLADDMGLGKTIQGLALLVERAPQGASLIVAPTSVCLNWESEAKRFAPTLNPKTIGTGDRQRLLDNLAPFDLLICSYGLLQQEQVADMLAKIRFQTVILDEAQAIKNFATRRSQGAMNLQGEFKVIMTGTPLENHLGELWNLFRFINPGLLGSQEQFNRRFAGPIGRDQNQQSRQQLKKLIQPFILRRTKTQVLQELPPRTEIPIYVELSTEEMAFYEALRRESIATLNDNTDSMGAKHLKILAAITRLRRSCCNTRLVNADISLPSSKLAAFGDIVEELLENKHKALVFSQFVDHLHIIKDFIEQRGINYQYLDGSTPAKERQERVNAFQAGKGDLFLISLKAGGVGINLTAADYVIHMDPWWNPAVEDQASDRAHRMGQQRPVTIYRMITKQTIEEKIVALHSHKT
ncbi:DEAD/DEAH box helicase [Methylocucumis oryzae]|uniref:DEAD/DEAH box helicase n=1 Tax=Methylocucumis oryzae TaxID=1632867 RepID=UPI000B00D625|nr:DEAD/DEAH box helicase [Methylocucumis oryzae]